MILERPGQYSYHWILMFRHLFLATCIHLTQKEQPEPLGTGLGALQKECPVSSCGLNLQEGHGQLSSQQGVFIWGGGGGRQGEEVQNACRMMHLGCSLDEWQKKTGVAWEARCWVMNGDGG